MGLGGSMRVLLGLSLGFFCSWVCHGVSGGCVMRVLLGFVMRYLLVLT